MVTNRRGNQGRGHTGPIRSVFERYRTIGLFVFVTVAMGGAYVVNKFGVDAVPPVFFAALRFDIAAVLLLGYAIYGDDRWRPRTRADWVAIVVSGTLLFTAANALLNVGQQYTPSATAAVVRSLTPILTVLLVSVLLPDDRLSPIELAGVGLGFVGVVIVAGPTSTDLLGTGGLGVVLVFGSAASVSLGSVLVRGFRTDLSSTALTGWASLVGALSMHGLSLGLGEEVVPTEWTPAVLVALCYLGVVAGAGAHAAIFALLEEVGPTRTNLLSYAMPVVTAFGGWVLLGEVLTTATGVGFVCVLAGFALVNHDVFVTARHRHSGLTPAESRADLDRS